MHCRTTFVTRIAGDAAADRQGHLGVPDGIITKRTTIVNRRIMTGGTDDRLTGDHVVTIGQDRIKIVTRQNVSNRSNLGSMAGDAGDVAVRNSHSGMQNWPCVWIAMTAEACFPDEGHVRAATILINPIIRSIKGAGVDVGI